ncbi:hypothetical protein WOLCODRAFT_166789 [Wolfiporia cocos MD-104 SS10]|uniref:Uncharacterized protein n=1 Tax=Wolfiporia cocos (strain MD-104) TaxID=742152 RepID=A0A2H3JJS1_WOLCO|nr:hypothetical protein WOLCODRAFT_166789 [Wolfiporia cocos MD-104 SS10]
MARVRKLPARPRLPDARHAMTKGQHTLKAIPAMTEAHDRLLRYNSLHAHSRVTMSREHRSRSSQTAGTPNPSPKRLPRRLQGIDPSMLPQWRDRSLTGPAGQSRRRPSSARSTSASIPSFTDTNDQPNALGIIPGTSSFSTTSFDTSHRSHLSLSVAPPSRSFPGSESGSLSPISPLFPNPSCSGSDAGHHVVQSQSSSGSYTDHLPVPAPVSPAMSAGELSISRSNSSTPSSQGHSAYGPYTPPRGGYGHGRHLTPNPVQGHAYQAASPTSASVYSRSPHSPVSTRGSSHTAVSPLPSAHPHYPAPAPQPSNADYVPPASYNAPHMGPFGPRTAGLDMPVHSELRLRPGVPAFYPRTAREISHRQDMPPVLPPRIPSSQPRIPIPENDDTPQWMIDAMEGKADAESVNMQNLEANIHWDVFDSLPQVPDQ